MRESIRKPAAGLAVVAVVVAVLGSACGGESQPAPEPQSVASPYVGQETRDIKALDSAAVAGLLAGEGLGYALAAELNGLPGPRHVLDAADALGLTADQRARVQAVFDAMKGEAVRIGRQIVEEERALDRLFAAGSASPEAVAERTRELGALQGELRNVHLQAHLRTTPVLTAEQRAHYRAIRGYGERAPDASGHTGSHTGH